MKTWALVALAICAANDLGEARGRADDRSQWHASVEGASELKFEEFFRLPIGPAGLVFTDKIKGLDGKRVSIVGYVVKQERKTPGVFLLAPLPVELNEEHYGLADDLPASTLFVHDLGVQEQDLGKVHGMRRVTGILSLGNREEANGRISAVRLNINPVETKSKATAVTGHSAGGKLAQKPNSESR